MEQITILWADDEIDLLKPHILFLESKGYKLFTANNGEDALEMIENHKLDLVFLDENMPGLSGLETLVKVKELRPTLPVIMITKSEEESIMEEAIGSRIADYLIKPVNPNQILSSIKKNIDNKRLVSEKVNFDYQTKFRELTMRLNDRLDANDWIDLYKKLVYWELELNDTTDKQMVEILEMQKKEANKLFCDFIENNYADWLHGDEDAPDLSHKVFQKKVWPELRNDESVFLIVIDNLRYDQWKALEPRISEFFRIKEESCFYSILPTATQYARNAFFSGLLPSEMEKKYPNLWVNDEDEGGKNLNEEAFLTEHLKRLGKPVKFSYNKITNLDAGKKMVDNFQNMLNNPFNVIVYNFVDMLSHARSDMQVIKELADDESAYRSITKSWFEYSPLFALMKKISEKKGKVIITTDHGTIKVKNPVKIIGEKNITSNLRYKTGRNMNYNEKDVFEVVNPSEAFLPKQHINSRYVFARESDYFVYPNNYNHFVNMFRNSFQHGGISLEEIIIPFVVLESK